MKCNLCDREALDKGYCGIHSLAYKNIIEKFAIWQRVTNVSWSQYLAKIQKNSLTGEWAKEVIKHLIEDENE